MNRIGVMVDSFRLGVPEGLRRAKALGAGAAQIYVGGRDATYEVWTPAYRREIRQLAQDQGLVISALCGDLGGHEFARAEENEWRVRETLDRINLCAEMNVPVLTTHIGVIPDDPAHPRYTTLQEAMDPLGRHAKQAHVMLAIETGPEKPETLLGFIQSLSGGIGVNYDPANLRMVLGIDPVPGVSTLGPYIVHTHAKDGRMIQYLGAEKVYGYFAEGGIEDLRLEDYFIETPLGQGEVDLPAWIQALDAVGYQGYVTIEREVGDQPEADIRAAIAALQALGLSGTPRT